MNKIPAIKSKITVSSVMLDNIISISPAAVWGCFVYGINSLIVIAASIFCCVLFEELIYLIQGDIKKIFNLKGVYFGLLIGICMSIDTKLYIPSICAALSGILIALYKPFGIIRLHASALPVLLTLILFKCNPQTGITGAFVIPSVIGYIYLMIKRQKSVSAFFACLLSVSLPALIMGIIQKKVLFLQIPDGIFMLYTLFILSDDMFLPSREAGKIIYGIICGLIIYFLGKYISGIVLYTFAVSAAALFTPILDRLIVVKPFGYSK